MGKFDLERGLIGFSISLIRIINEMHNSKAINDDSIINKSKIVNRCPVFDIQKNNWKSPAANN